jgi:hypothetical protein
MDKQDFIHTIKALYPIDSQFQDTSEVGKKLLIEAIEESDWRDLPVEILSLYAAKCEYEHNR